MAYIGNVPAEKYTALTQQTFSSPTGTSFTLSQAVTNSVDIDLYIDNVKQNPASYSVSGTALTTSTISSPSTMYCIFNGRTTETVNPPDDSVGLSQIASGTDGNLITFDASGNPAYVATGNDGQVLTSAGAGQPCAFEALPAGGTWNVVTSASLSSASSLSVTGISKFTRVLLVNNNTTDGGNALRLRTSTDNGSSFSSGASDYEWQNYRVTDSSSGRNASTGEAYINLGYNSGYVELLITRPDMASNQTVIHFNWWWSAHASDMAQAFGSGGRLNNEANDAIQIYPSSGSITGNYKVLTLDV